MELGTLSMYGSRYTEYTPWSPMERQANWGVKL